MEKGILENEVDVYMMMSKFFSAYMTIFVLVTIEMGST